MYVYVRSYRRDDEPARQECMDRLVRDLVARDAHRLVIDSRRSQDINDQRTLRRVLGPNPSMSKLAYEHIDSKHESLLWIPDAVAWCHGAGRDWRRRVEPIIAEVVDLDGTITAQSP